MDRNLVRTTDLVLGAFGGRENKVTGQALYEDVVMECGSGGGPQNEAQTAPGSKLTRGGIEHDRQRSQSGEEKKSDNKI